MQKSVDWSMQGTPSASRWRGDIFAGTLAALLSIPGGMAYGVVAFAPLGADYIPFGLMAGLLSVIVVNIASSPCSGNPFLVYNPEALSAVILASALTLLINSKIGQDVSQDPALVLTFLFLIVFAGGLLQLLFGLLKLGNLAKSIPHPVIAGLRNGVSLVIIRGQLHHLLGLPPDIALSDMDAIWTYLQPLTLVVGLVTIVFIWQGAKLTTRLPSPILGVVVGVLLYHGLKLIDTGWALGLVIGHIPIDIPTPHYARMFSQIMLTPAIFQHMLTLSPIIVSLAFAMSIKTLVTSVVTDQETQRRSDINREFVGQGFANMLAALFGGVTGSAHQGTSVSNVHAGGSTVRVRLLTGVFTILAVFVLGPFVAQIPSVVLAGLLIAISIRLFDCWPLELLQRFSAGPVRDRGMIVDFLIVSTVTLVLFVFGIFESIAVGVVIAIVFFVFSMSRGCIRREYDAQIIRSNADRPTAEVKLLDRYGHRIHVFELEGALFFGTADKLADLTSPIARPEIDFVIFDLRRVSHIDSTGAKALVHLQTLYATFEKSLVLSGIDSRQSHPAFHTVLAVLYQIGHDHIFVTIDDALTWAEDRLLDDFLDVDRHRLPIDLSNVDVLDQFSPTELDVFRHYCSSVAFTAGDIIYKQGGASESMLLILQGRVGVYLNYETPREWDRLATIEPGTVLGEMGFLMDQPRTATAVAMHRLTGAVLAKAQLRCLEQEHPALANKFLAGLGRVLARRLSTRNRLVTELRA